MAGRTDGFRSFSDASKQRVYLTFHASPNPSRHRTPRYTRAIKDQCVYRSKAGVLRPANARRVEKAMEGRNALARRTRVHPTTPTRVSLRLVFRVKDGLDFSSRDGRHPAPTHSSSSRHVLWTCACPGPPEQQVRPFPPIPFPRTHLTESREPTCRGRGQRAHGLGLGLARRGHQRCRPESNHHQRRLERGGGRRRLRRAREIQHREGHCCSVEGVRQTP